MVICCLSMGFATDLVSCTIFRFFAGTASSTVLVTTLTMIGDLSEGATERAKNVAKLPIVALLGSVGPVVQGLVSGSVNAENGSIWQSYPALSTQIACGSLVFLIALVATIMLKEVSLFFRSKHHRAKYSRLCLCHHHNPIPWISTAKRPPFSLVTTVIQPPSIQSSPSNLSRYLLASFSRLRLSSFFCPPSHSCPFTLPPLMYFFHISATAARNTVAWAYLALGCDSQSCLYGELLAPSSCGPFHVLWRSLAC